MRFDLWLADACRTADVSYDDLILTIAIGGYPCLPGTASGSSRTFDETDVSHSTSMAGCLPTVSTSCGLANMQVACMTR